MINLKMADQSSPTPQPAPSQPAPPTEPASSSTPPTASTVPPETPGNTDLDPKAAEPISGTAPTIPADPLADGTVPTVLATGSHPKPTPKGRVSITSIYRKADVITTLITFTATVVAAAVIFGIYAYLTRSKTPTAKAPAVTTLNQADLDKLGAFFEGNSAGSTSQVLTISASSLFKNRVALGSDLKVVGGVQVSGTTALGDLTVDKTSTLGVTNVRGQLTVAGPLSLQSPAILGAGASVNGNLAVSGNGSFGGSISAGTINATNLSVTGTLNLAGHISIAGQTPSTSIVAGVTTSANVEGNDASGVVSVVAAPSPDRTTTGAQLVTVNFQAPYPRVPHVVITPVGRGAALLEPYIIVTATNFTIGAAVMAASTSTANYSFDYWIVQ